jgi:glyoxylase-like metal-dependent hydrolase (beta-lactamase superfamily II)
MEALTLNQISSHVYWLPPDSTTDRPVLGAITGERGALLVDAGNSEAHAGIFLAELARLEIKPTYLTLTHWHWDHVFGTAAFDLPTLASIETKNMVTRMARLDWRDEALDRRVARGEEIAFCRDMIKAELPNRDQLKLVPPHIGFSRQIELDLGGATCQIVHVGGDHAGDSSVIFIPEDKIIFISDCLYHDIYGGEAYTPAKLFPLIDRLLAFDAAYYLTGHDAKPTPRAEMIEMTTEMKRIGQLVQRLVGQFGADRAAIKRECFPETAAPPDEFQAYLVDAFVAGVERAARR